MKVTTITAPLPNMLLAVVFLIALLAGTSTGQEQDERAEFRTRQQALQIKVAALTREQDLLLFQREMYAADSKYLILNIAERRGQLSYKNRILKTFRFTLSGNPSLNALQPGALVLTKKAGGAKGRLTLLFGTSLLLHEKRASVSKQGAGLFGCSLRKKDMVSIFSAVEEGALAYIVR